MTAAVAERKSRGGRPAEKPCGTEAAYYRHLRHHEEPCEPCRAASRRKASGEAAGSMLIDRREAPRNGLDFKPYVYQGRSPFMRRLAINAGLLPEPREEVPVAVRVQAEEPAPAVAPKPDGDGRCEGCGYLVAKCNCADLALLRARR